MLLAFWLHYIFVCALSDQRKSIAFQLFCSGALVCVNGTWMSIRECKNSFNCSAEWFDLVAMYVEISWLNLSLFIELRFCLITGTDGGLGMLISRLQSSVKWSDVSSLETELDTIILSSGRYTIQSRICPCVCVGRFTNCARLKIWKRSGILTHADQ